MLLANPYPPTIQLDAHDLIQIVHRKGVSACLSGIAQRITDDFIRWHDFVKCARISSHSTEGVIELMPIADAHTYSFKYVNGHPSNTRKGLPTVMAFGVLADVHTGAPRLIAELTLTTALRTAAMSAVAARWLARPNSRVMAMIGNGAQSEFQALAFRDLVGIDTIRVYDLDRAATDKLVANLADQRITVQRCSSTAEAIQGADIITTLTADKHQATIVHPDMVQPGMHINAVGGDCPGKTELHPDLLRAAEVFVEYEPQTRIEGDIQQMPADFPVVELWQVLTQRHPGRSNRSAITVFDSVGFALEDFSALCFLRDAAAEVGVGRVIELIPHAADPKNLFGVVRGLSSTGYDLGHHHHLMLI